MAPVDALRAQGRLETEVVLFPFILLRASVETFDLVLFSSLGASLGFARRTEQSRSQARLRLAWSRDIDVELVPIFLASANQFSLACD